jgi:hypothetical protein
MPLNLQKRPQRPSDKVKHLFLAAEDPGTQAVEYFPYFYVEARIDFNDVRTGLRDTVSLNKALEIYSDSADLLWADDMVRDVDPPPTGSSLPDSARLAALPDFVDANFISRMETQFVQYLMRSFVAGLYRNSVLNVYSFLGESRAEFSSRCLELFDGPKRKELDLLHDVFNRRIEQLKERYLGAMESEGLELAKAESQNKNMFSRCSERIAGFFLRGELSANAAAAVRRPKGMQELEERLLALESEARLAIAKLKESYEEKARALDEYTLHPNLRDIHFVRSCILWMPKKPA